MNCSIISLIDLIMKELNLKKIKDEYKENLRVVVIRNIISKRWLNDI